MNILRYVQQAGSTIEFSERQASDFAKGVAGDFNPLHDVGSKRFCVPGDLLFAVLLHRYGIYENMHIEFVGMLSAGIKLSLPEQLAGELELKDHRDRSFLKLRAQGDCTQNEKFVSQLVHEYVRFSGKTFPDILVDLMRQSSVMINPARPLVIYQNMSLALDSMRGDQLDLSLSNASLSVDGKKATARLQFSIFNGSEHIGQGEKNMLLGGLREFDEAAMDNIVAQYNQWKQLYGQQHNAV